MVKDESISLTEWLKWKTELPSNHRIYNVSIHIDKFNKMSFMFRSHEGRDITALARDAGEMEFRLYRISNANAPSFAGQDLALYSRNGAVYATDFGKTADFPLCHSLSSNLEKNWGVFNISETRFNVVYSVVPLRIFIVDRDTRRCKEDFNVKHTNKNLVKIDHVIGPRDERNTANFRGGTRGVLFAGRYEHLFVGHVTQYKDQSCFPHWFASRQEYKKSKNPANQQAWDRMYHMYFFTVGRDSAAAPWKIMRLSSCFQPPDTKFNRVVFPSGLGYDIKHDRFVLSYGRNDDDCRLTYYSRPQIEVLLQPVDSWTAKNYVIHPNYASSIFEQFDIYCQPRKYWDRAPLLLTGICDTSELHRFNNSIVAADKSNRFLNISRVTQNARTWKTRNDVAIQTMSLDVLPDKRVLVQIDVDDENIFTLGVSHRGGEDARLISVPDGDRTRNLIIFNDVDVTTDQRYIMLQTLDKHMIPSKSRALCRNISGEMEKNWSPFVHDNELHVVYSVDPLKVINTHLRSDFDQTETQDIRCRFMKESETPHNLREIFKFNNLSMRGGTPGIKIADDEYLFCGHSVTMPTDGCFPDFVIQDQVALRGDDYVTDYGKFYCIFFYTIILKDDKWVLNRLSCCSQLPGKLDHYSKIVFPCGLARSWMSWDKQFQSYVVSYGERDVWCNYAIMTETFLKFILKPVSHWNVHNYVVDISYFSNVANLNPNYKQAHNDW